MAWSDKNWGGGCSSILSLRPTWFPPAAHGLEPLRNADSEAMDLAE